MKKLIEYEFWKLWKKTHMFFVVAFSLLVISLPTIVISYKDNFVVLQGFCLTFYVMTFIALMSFPIITSIKDFNNDISKSHAVLELSLPFQSWKKIFSHLVVTICTLFINLLAVNVYTFILLKCFAGSENGYIKNLFSGININAFSSPKSVLSALVSIIGYITFITICYFCIAFIKFLSHKIIFGVPLGVIICSAFLIAFFFIGTRIPIPYMQGYSIYLRVMLIDIVFIVPAFLGTSWLLENKVEC